MSALRLSVTRDVQSGADGADGTTQLSNLAKDRSPSRIHPPLGAIAPQRPVDAAVLARSRGIKRALNGCKVYKNAMDLEWDERKREGTLRELSLDFGSVAQADWDAALTVEDNRAVDGKTRIVSLVRIQERLCVFAWCVRGDRLRVINLR